MAYMCRISGGECIGCGSCEKVIKCPVCGQEVYEHLYRLNKIIVGCDQCIEEYSIEDYTEE